MIGSLRPAVLLVIVGPLFGEKVRLPTTVWTGIAIAGVAIMLLGAGSGSSNSIYGDSLAATGMLVGTAFLVVSKNARTSHDALTYTTAMTMIAALVLLPIAMVSEATFFPVPPAADWAKILMMAALPGSATS